MPEGRKRILIVDDDDQVVTGTRLRLEQAGYETASACDGQDGVRLAHEYSPDVVLMDVQMPRMNGLTALSHLRADPTTSSIPVVMLSASLQDQSSALDAGARFFVKKPYDGPDLVDAVNKAMN